MLVLIHSKHIVIQSQTLLKNSSQIYEWIEKNKKHNKIVASKFVRSRLFCTWKTEGKEMEKPTLSHSIINTSHNRKKDIMIIIINIIMIIIIII